jgi:hypothetical protein
MVVHFAQTYKVICNSSATRNGGALFSRYKKYVKYRDFHKDAQWLYTTSDEQVTCPDCAKIRIAYHEEMISKLKSKMSLVPPVMA